MTEEILDFEWEQKSNDTLFIHHVIAGCFAGVTEHCLLLPFDNIKTHAQVAKVQTKSEITDIIKTLYIRGGILGFWKGASVIASGCIPAHAAYFSIFEGSKKFLIHKDDKSINFHLFGMAGILGTIAHDLIITPFDVLKQRTQILKESSISILRETIKTEGVKALFRSFPITMAMNIPWSGILVATNESLKLITREQEHHTFSSYFLCAGISASFASLLTIPLDNIKTRLQTQSCQQSTCNNLSICSFNIKNKQKPIIPKVSGQGRPSSFSMVKVLQKFSSPSRLKDVRKSCHLLKAEPKIKYKDIQSTVKTILKEEGFKGFTKGVVPRILGQAPSAAVSWSSYEMIKKWLVRNEVFTH